MAADNRRKNVVSLSTAGKLALLAVLLGVIPFGLPSYMVGQFSLAVVYAVAILGLNMITGYVGSISLGHGAFFAVGAYVAAILMHRYGWDPYTPIPVAGLVCWVAGLLFGIPALRLRGLYLALGTLTLAVTVGPVLKRFTGVTGGSQGLFVGTPLAPANLGIGDSQWVYLFVLAVAGVMFLVARNVIDRGLRRALVATRDNEIVASVMGVDLARYKSLTFAVSSMYAGVAGAMYTLVVGYVSPDSFPIMLSLSFFVGAVIGGLTSISGAVYGALFIQFVPVWASDVDRALAGFVYGGALIAAMLLMPDGVAGLIEKLRRRPDDGRTGKTGSRKKASRVFLERCGSLAQRFSVSFLPKK